MDQQNAGNAPRELGFGGWILFWLQLGVLAVLIVLGAAFASQAAEPGDYACGMILSLAAVALAFLQIKNRFDGAGVGWGGLLLVDDTTDLIAVIIAFVVLALVGLYFAADYRSGGLHNAGVALFAVSALGIFLSLKNVFDRLDRQR